MPVTFLFWNICKKPLEAVIANLAHRHQVDVIMLAESILQPVTLLNILNSKDRATYHYVSPLACTRIEILTRFPSRFVPPVYELDKMTIRKLLLPGLMEILLAIIHFPSKLHWDDQSQAFESIRFAREISKAEIAVGHSRTVVVGDFNMNPFEDGVVSANGFHGVMCRSIAEGRSRVVQDHEYSFFYNPMWSLFGDASPGPPGTYYLRSAKHKVFFWNIFDQVLVRPDLIDRFSHEDLKVLEDDGTTSFLKNGLPNTSVASDHLPILFRLHL